MQSETPSTVSQLASAVSLARSDDSAVRRRLEERERVEHLDILAEHMHALRPWTGEPEELRTLCVPDVADIACCKGAIDDVERRVGRHQEEIDRLSAELARLKAEVEAAGKVAGIVSDQQAANIRGRTGGGLGRSQTYSGRILCGGLRS